MAESEKSSSGRRVMSPEQLQIIHSTVYRKPDNHRGASVADPAVDFRSDLLDRDGAFSKDNSSDNSMPKIRANNLSLMHCNLNSKLNVQDMWNDVSKTVESLENVDPMKDIWAMMGNVYDHGNYCEFLLAMYQLENGGPVLDFKRMSGDGFVMDGFYRNVIASLQETNKELIVGVEETDGDEPFDDYSDDEDSEDGRDSEENTHLSNYGYLQLSYDPNLVPSWVEKIKTRHVEDKNHMMGLMAYNASNKQNLDIIVEKGGKNLRDLCMLQLEESNSAALVRNTSALVKAVTSVDACKNDGYDEDFVESIFVAMVYWVPNNGRRNQQTGSSSFDITESREAVDNLVAALYNLKRFVGEDAISAKAKASLKPEQTATIIAYLKNQKTSDPVDFLLHILKNISVE